MPSAQPPQFAQGPLERFGSLDLLAGRERGECREPKIHAHRLPPWPARFGVGNLDRDGDKPAVGVSVNHRALDLAGEPQSLRHPHRTDHGKAHTRTIHAELVIGNVVAIPALALLLESRMPGAALKEITERLGKISEWLRVGIPVDVCQPGKLLVFDSVEPAL